MKESKRPQQFKGGGGQRFSAGCSDWKSWKKPGKWSSTENP